MPLKTVIVDGDEVDVFWLKADSYQSTPIF